VRGSGQVHKHYSLMSEEQLNEQGLTAEQGDGREPLLKNEDMKKRWNDLEEVNEEIDKADLQDDKAQVQRLNRVKEQLLEDLAPFINLTKDMQKKNVRGRQWDPANEKARKRIGKAIRKAIETINEQSPALAEHLKANITPLKFPFSYSPTSTVPWRTDPIKK